MSFISYIEKLRTEPEEKRRRVAFLSAGTITILIFFVWLSIGRFNASSGGQLASGRQRLESGDQTAAASLVIGKEQSVIEDIKDRVSRGWERIRETF